MSLLCYHASHEQFAPSQLLQWVQQAQTAGFQGIHSSDHFHPWSRRQGQSGYAFSWIAAALQATVLPFSMVCAPGQRYHPAIAAQAMATLAEMFPGRVNFELGSGEALNEVITGDDWPSKEMRNRRLLECANIIRSLLNGETVDHAGMVRVHHATLYTRPVIQPLLLCAAISAETSAWAASWADGLLTTADNEVATKKKIQLFRQQGGAGKPVYLQLGFSYARSRQQAVEGLYDQWRSNILPREKLAALRTVEDFDGVADTVTRDEVLDAIPVFDSMDQLFDRINALEQLGADRIVLHNINRDQETFINDFGVFARLRNNAQQK